RRRTWRGGGRTRVAGVVVAALVATGLALPAPAATAGAAGPESFSSDPNPTWGTSPSDNPGDAGSDRAGKVLAVAEVGDRVFLAGEFTGLMPPGASTNKARQDPTPIVPRRYLAALDVKTGALLDWDAQVDGPVMALAASPDGRRLYLGGTFRRVGSTAQARLAAVDVATGAVDPAFRPPSPSAYVRALALSGDKLFVGGAFVAVGTEPRSQLVAVDTTTGALLEDWVPPGNAGGHFTGHTGAAATDDGSHGHVHDLKVTGDGSMLLVGGSFLDWAGHKGILALDTETAQPTSWQPALDQGRPVYGLDIFPADGRTIFVAAGGSGGTVEAFRPDAGRKPLWIHRVDGDATDVAATTSRLYLVGHYDYVLGKNTTCGAGSCTGGNDGDVVNHHISAFDPITGAHDLSFTAQFNTPQGPEVAVLGADHLYVGGNFTKVNDLPHPGFVQFAAATN
ncbi:MAG: hypothetical protein LC792_17545, partial [Actinobacteria bacterium]|nr:hypothetical protein [Actinomycetota bacterium]